jgi:hypothetical protein
LQRRARTLVLERARVPRDGGRARVARGLEVGDARARGGDVGRQARLLRRESGQRRGDAAQRRRFGGHGRVARAQRVELRLNGAVLGRKRLRHARVDGVYGVVLAGEEVRVALLDGAEEEARLARAARVRRRRQPVQPGARQPAAAQLGVALARRSVVLQQVHQPAQRRQDGGVRRRAAHGSQRRL